MNEVADQAHRELENLRDTLLSGTSYIQAYLLKIEHKVRDMSAALALCQEVMNNCDLTNGKGNKG